MELVVVNGASNISKRVIQSLCHGGKYNKVRLLDFKPYHQHVYAFQREMNAQGVEVDKRITTNGTALDIAMEGADKLVYFTHDYTSLVSCKNNFLIGSAKLAKKHGISSMAAVLPVEHDLIYTEHDSLSWLQERQEAEQQALQAHKNLTLLSSDLVYSEEPTHMIQYLAQCVEKGSLPSSFISEAKFRPVHSEDVASAVAHVLNNAGHGHFSLRGSQEVSLKQLVNLIEKSLGKEAGSTSASKNFKVTQLLEEFFTGMTVHQNLKNLAEYCAEHETPVFGADFWEASGVKQTHNVNADFAKTYITKESLAFPSAGDYKLPHMNF